MSKKNEKSERDLLEEINKKLDALVILSCIKELSGSDRLNVLKHSVGIKPVARVLGRDKSSFKKKIKKGGEEKNGTN